MPKHPVAKAKNKAAQSTRKKRSPARPSRESHPSPEIVARAIVKAVIDQVAEAFSPDE